MSEEEPPRKRSKLSVSAQVIDKRRRENEELRRKHLQAQALNKKAASIVHAARCFTAAAQKSKDDAIFFSDVGQYFLDAGREFVGLKLLNVALEFFEKARTYLVEAFQLHTEAKALKEEVLKLLKSITETLEERRRRTIAPPSEANIPSRAPSNTTTSGNIEVAFNPSVASPSASNNMSEERCNENFDAENRCSHSENNDIKDAMIDSTTSGTDTDESDL